MLIYYMSGKYNDTHVVFRQLFSRQVLDKFLDNFEDYQNEQQKYLERITRCVSQGRLKES